MHVVISSRIVHPNPHGGDFRVKQCEKCLNRELRESVSDILREFGCDINDVMA